MVTVTLAQGSRHHHHHHHHHHQRHHHHHHHHHHHRYCARKNQRACVALVSRVIIVLTMPQSCTYMQVNMYGCVYMYMYMFLLFLYLPLSIYRYIYKIRICICICFCKLLTVVLLWSHAIVYCWQPQQVKQQDAALSTISLLGFWVPQRI